MFVLGFPLLLVPFVIYNIVAFILRLPDDIWTTRALTVHMMSQQEWIMTWEDILLAFSILLLWVELIKSTRIGMRSVMDHILAMALFIGMLVISYFGDFGSGGIIGGIGIFKHVLDGGNDDLGLVGGLLASAAWSLIIYRLAIVCRLPEAVVDRYVADVYPPPVD